MFAIVKRLWGFSKVRYRELHKNATRAFTALALANIYMAAVGQGAPVRAREAPAGGFKITMEWRGSPS